MWPFSKRRDVEVEKRAYEAGYTEGRLKERRNRISGRNQDPIRLIVTEVAAGLWERALSTAMCVPEVPVLSPSVFALIGRTLARCGEIVFRLKIESGDIRIFPASGLDVDGKGQEPEGWRYRLDLAGLSRTKEVRIEGAGVLHFRINAEHESPWRGRAPLDRPTDGRKLAGVLEKGLISEMGSPSGKIAPVPPSTPEQTEEHLHNLLSFLLVTYALESADGGLRGSDFTVHSFGPRPEQVTLALRSEIGREILLAYGIPPVLFNPTGDGRAQRESWRRFVLGTMLPIVGQIQAEAQFKLDLSELKIDLEALRAEDEEGRSRAINRRAMAFKVL